MTLMQLPSRNRITCDPDCHTYPAVDYDNEPDDNVYAPFQGLATASGNPYNNPNNRNDCGWRFELVSDDAQWKAVICHNKKTTWTRKRFRKGVVMGKIWYSGYTEPAGPAGAHLHFVLFKKQGDTWVRVPDPHAEVLKNSKEVSVLNEALIKNLWVIAFDKQPTPEDIKAWNGKPTNDLVRWIRRSNRFKNYQSQRQENVQKIKDLQQKVTWRGNVINKIKQALGVK